MDLPDSSRDLFEHVRIERRTSVPFDRMIGMLRPGTERHLHFLMIHCGHAICSRNELRADLQDRAAILFPGGHEMKVTFASGTTGVVLSASPLLLSHAVGTYPEAQLIRHMVRQPLVIPRLSTEAHEELSSLTGRMLTEYAMESGGSWMVHSALLRLLLVAIFRQGPGTGRESDVPKPSTAILGTYRQLIELHFREHWPVTRYAGELDITQGRLHSLCRRELQCTPLDLIHRRLVHEAKLRLERTSDAVEEIAFRLGYSDTTYFRHFFKRMTGEGPGAYRRNAQGVTR